MTAPRFFNDIFYRRARVTLFAKHFKPRKRDFALALVIAGLRLLVRAISATVLDDMRDGEAERTGVRLVRFVFERPEITE